MSNDLNVCNFIGRLGADVEVRATQSGMTIASFRIAVGWKSRDKEGTEWVSVTAFDKLGDICAQYLTKGSQVFISGRMTTETYEKNGEKRYATKIIADRMQMLGGREERQEQAPRQQRSEPPRQQRQAPKQQEIDDDDIPF